MINDTQLLSSFLFRLIISQKKKRKKKEPRQETHNHEPAKDSGESSDVVSLRVLLSLLSVDNVNYSRGGRRGSMRAEGLGSGISHGNANQRGQCEEEDEE